MLSVQQISDSLYFYYIFYYFLEPTILYACVCICIQSKSYWGCMCVCWGAPIWNFTEGANIARASPGLSPQNTFGVSGVNSVRAESNTIEVNGDRLCHPSVRKLRHWNSTRNASFTPNRLPKCPVILLWRHVHVRTHTSSRPRAEWALALLPLVACHFRQQTFRLNTWCKWPCLKSNLNFRCLGSQTLGWHHRSRMEAFYVFFCCSFSRVQLFPSEQESGGRDSWFSPLLMIFHFFINVKLKLLS